MFENNCACFDLKRASPFANMSLVGFVTLCFECQLCDFHYVLIVNSENIEAIYPEYSAARKSASDVFPDGILKKTTYKDWSPMQ
jgi:hypothetical protein